MKNKIALLLIFLGVIGFSFSASAAGVPSDVADTEFESSYIVLNALGVTDIGEEGLFMPYSRLTRGEFATMIERLIQPDEDVHADMIYSDVTESHSAYTAVKYLSYYGTMVGYGDGTFRADQDITYNEALTVCMRLLGYGQIADADGRFFTEAAARSGLLNGVSTDNGYINKGNAVRLLANMLDSSMVECALDGKTYTVDGDKTMLNEICCLYKTTGIVDGDSYQSMTADKKIKEGMIKLNSMYMVYEGEDYVGYNVTCYYFVNDDDEYEVRAIIPKTAKNTVVEISAESISDPDNLWYIEYKNENNKKKKIKYDSNVVVIYNGKNLESFSIDVFKNLKNGYIQAIDNDSDGVSECIKVWEYYNVVVDFADDEKIVDRFDNTLNITTKDYEKISVFNAYGEAKAITDIKAGSVASIFKSKTTSDNILKIVFSEKTVSGMVSGSNEEDNIKYVTIDDNEYVVYSDYKTYTSKVINIGDNGTYLLDMNDKVVTVNAQTYSGYSLGLLVHSRQTIDDYSGQDIMEIKVYLSEGKLVKFVADDKVIIDGTTYKRNELSGAEAAISTHISEPILYKLDKDGKLKKIDTIAQDSNGMLKKLDTVTGVRYLSSTSILEGKLVIDNDVRVFTVPSDFTEVEEEDFSTAGHSYFIGNSTYNNVTGYTINDGMAAEVVVIQGETSLMNHLAEIVLVTGRGSGINSEEDNADYIKVLSNGVESTLYEANAGVLNDVYKITRYSRAGDTLVSLDNTVTDRKIAKGDIIKYSTDANGNLEKVSLIYDASEKEMVSCNPYHTDFHEQGYRYVMGEIDEKYDGYIRLTYSATSGTVTEYHNISVGKIYSVEMDGGVHVKEMAFGELSDKVHNNKADKVFIVSNAGIPKAAYIFK